MKLRSITCLLILLLPVVTLAQSNSTKTFYNPLLPSGADPWVTYNKGYYYYTNTAGGKLVIWKTKSVVDLKTAQRTVVWAPPTGTAYSKEIWAPELHQINNKWYIYFAADNGDNKNHRLYVLENNAKDPTKGQWEFKGQIGDATNKWAIDGSVFEHKGKLYMVWAGWEGDENGQQDIYIARLKDPLTVETERVKISTPTYPWERVGDLHDKVNPPHVNVNEGPQILKHGNQVFLIYSASGCWTDNYSLGMLTLTADGDLLNPASWKKSPDPVFKQTPENSVYAPGHNCFFKSPDGKQDWILYHANSAPGQGCGRERSPRAQPFTWRADGTPDFGAPLPTTQAIPVPSGTK